ncbi:unnamed protein product [Symbiodinium sp. CCMP2456]|nr:unnamed protein product [Symbiodinium sp. CCMP2456]
MGNTSCACFAQVEEAPVEYLPDLAKDLQESDIVALAPIAEDVAEANAMKSVEELPTLLKLFNDQRDLNIDEIKAPLAPAKPANPEKQLARAQTDSLGEQRPGFRRSMTSPENWAKGEARLRSGVRKAAGSVMNAISASRNSQMLCASFGTSAAATKDDNADPRKWAIPDGAEERQASLVHSLDRGVFVSGHLDAGVQLTKHDRQAFLGDLTCTHAETRHTSKAAPAKAQPLLRRFDPGSKSVESPTSSPPSFSNSSWSEVSSPLLSPLPSPAESRAPSPRKRLLSGDDATSSASFSTADTICKVEVELVEEPSAPVLGWAKVSSPCAWMEVDLDNELARAKDHNNWWAKLSGEFRQATSCVRAERRRTLERHEAVAAMWRELSVDNEVLHTILGYGTERATMVIVHQTAPTFHGLRHFTFSKDRCHLLLAQGSKAIAYLHKNGVTHGHLCPESFLMDETSLEPRVRLAWTPGQRRNEGHAPATFGFKGPGEDATPPSDIWSFGCVVLVWFANFKPAPHPWFQFAKSHRLKEAIQTALAQNPPELPKAYFDLHLAASEAEEGDTHLALAVQMCTRCLEHDPLERAGSIHCWTGVCRFGSVKRPVLIPGERRFEEGCRGSKGRRSDLPCVLNAQGGRAACVFHVSGNVPGQRSRFMPLAALRSFQVTKRALDIGVVSLGWQVWHLQALVKHGVCLFMPDKCGVKGKVSIPIRT